MFVPPKITSQRTSVCVSRVGKRHSGEGGLQTLPGGDKVNTGGSARPKADRDYDVGTYGTWEKVRFYVFVLRHLKM